jgi:hypothetical protein
MFAKVRKFLEYARGVNAECKRVCHGEDTRYCESSSSPVGSSCLGSNVSQVRKKKSDTYIKEMYLKNQIE